LGFNCLTYSKASCNKLCVSHDSKHVYASGPRGTLQYEVVSNKNNTTNSPKSNFKYLTILASLNPALVQSSGIFNSLQSISVLSSTPESQNQTVITQEPNTNDLVLSKLNSDKKIEIGRLGGIFEQGKMIEHFHDYRGGDNAKYCFWKMGDDSIAIVDKKEWKIRNKVSMFWTYGGTGKEWEQKNPKSCMPVAACINKQGTRVMAASMAGPNEHLLHFYDEATHVDRSVSQICKSVLPDLNRCTALEISSNGRICYLGGLSQTGKTRLVAVYNNLDFAKICSYDMTDRKYDKIRRIYRVRGYEILLVGGMNHIVVVEFKSSQFIRLALLEDIHKGEISDICMRNDVIYSKGYNDSTITCTHLNLRQRLSQSLVNTTPKKNVDGSNRNIVDSIRMSSTLTSSDEYLNP
jgi:hypothetical protein